MSAHLAPDRYFARFNYERLLVEQAHVAFDGLWQLGEHFFVVCPSLADCPAASDGKPLPVWFDDNVTVGSPIDLVSAPPAGAVRVGPRSLEERICSAGEPLVSDEVQTALTLLLPNEFPDFHLSHRRESKLDVVGVPRALDDDEREVLSKAHAALGRSYPLVVEIVPGLPNVTSRYGQAGGGLALVEGDESLHVERPWMCANEHADRPYARLQRAVERRDQMGRHGFLHRRRLSFAS
jgi:hypothetical protein